MLFSEIGLVMAGPRKSIDMKSALTTSYLSIYLFLYIKTQIDEKTGLVMAAVAFLILYFSPCSCKANPNHRTDSE